MNRVMNPNPASRLCVLHFGLEKALTQLPGGRPMRASDHTWAWGGWVEATAGGDPFTRCLGAHASLDLAQLGVNLITAAAAFSGSDPAEHFAISHGGRAAGHLVPVPGHPGGDGTALGLWKKI